MGVRIVLLVALLAVPACGRLVALLDESYDKAESTLLNSEIPDFHADMRLARSLARFCPRYGFDEPLYSNMLAKRHAIGRGLIAADRQMAAIDAMTEVRLSEFFKTYGVLPGDGDVCPAADAEMENETALSALLVPGGGV
jgi:hypothetical protein